MEYKDFKDLKLSALGFGTMRLPLLSEDPTDIDYPQVEKMFKMAMDAGVNYFDTAYMYHGNASEVQTGKALKQFPRESFYLATKFPGMKDESRRNAKTIFEEQLAKCDVDYFDFYLIHNVSEPNLEGYLDEGTGLMDYLREQKKNGRIKHLGFSCHAQYSGLEKFLEKYHDEMEFCQLQINWLDWKLQEAEKKVQLCEKYNIPVWVMEPVRGGKLASLDPKYEAKLKAMEPDWSMPEWAFRFVNSIPSVKMILSGMSNLEQVEQNLNTFSTPKPFTEKHKALLLEICDEMLKEETLPCTACRYCCSYCPKELPIPELIKVYNGSRFSDGVFYLVNYINTLPEEKRPGMCIGCGQCQSVCPQAIDVPELMKTLDKIYTEEMAKRNAK